MTKEPRRVQINNERQLDDRGLVSLHLFVLTLHKTEQETHSLPNIINKIRDFLNDNISAQIAFENSLREAGYLDVHAKNYSMGYLIKKQELFCVCNSFPRLIEMPNGVGDIRYSLTISACTDFKVDHNSYLRQFIEE
jgi:hypothetical protein